MNKKGAEDSGMMKYFIEMALVVLLIIVVIWGMYKLEITDYFSNLPNFNQTEYGKKIIVEQQVVPEKEKERDHGQRYPIIRLHYTEGIDDLFAFRWNPNIDKVQVVMNIRWTTIAFGIPDGERSKEWQIDPDLSEYFREQKGLFAYEKEDVIKIMRTKSEEEMIGKIAEVAQKEEVYIEFPEFNIDASIFKSEIKQYAKLSAEQIKEKLHEVYSWYYENK